jgi:hypothetical protein
LLDFLDQNQQSPKTQPQQGFQKLVSKNPENLTSKKNQIRAPNVRPKAHGRGKSIEIRKAGLTPIASPPTVRHIVVAGSEKN